MRETITLRVVNRRLQSRVVDTKRERLPPTTRALNLDRAFRGIEIRIASTKVITEISMVDVVNAARDRSLVD